MSRAPVDPAFPAEGVPLSVLLDFDGTISRSDVGDTLLATLFHDPDLVWHKDQLYLSGDVGSRELIAWDMEVLPRDAAVLLEVVDAIPVDETLIGLVAAVRDVGGVVEIVSDGVGFHIERMLSRLGLTDVPVATNQTTLGLGGAGVSFPYGHPRCHVCGTCKRERVRRHRDAGRAVVFVGDGPSDRYAANHADVIFAKHGLATWCEAEGIAHQAWTDLSDVTAWLQDALASGRLPATRSDYPAWADRARPSSERYICGPEVWDLDEVGRRRETG